LLLLIALTESWPTSGVTQILAQVCAVMVLEIVILKSEDVAGMMPVAYK